MKNIFLFAAMIVVCLTLTGGTPGFSADRVEGELLLTVAPPTDAGLDRDDYLADIARLADAAVVKVYDALSLTPDDPLLLLIRSETLSTDEMAARLDEDERVLSATPNEIVRIRKAN
ncbi:hypothetical protein LJC31_03105 [Synergistaceae bacterium OttesenSCG-928-I11]|nr:hypothetical protein [Synergistaceae bacterium OttesenSCG-928-I11]